MSERFARYAFALAVTLVALAASAGIRGWTGDGFFGFGYAAVAASVWFSGPGPALLSIAVFATGSRLVLLAPYWSASGPDGAAQARWLVFIPVSVLVTVMGRAMWRARGHAEDAQRAAERVAGRASLLVEMGVALDGAATVEQAAQVLADQVIGAAVEVAVVEIEGRHGHPAVVAAAHRDPAGRQALRSTGVVVDRLRAGGTSVVTVPLTARGERVGVLLMGRDAGAPPMDDADREFAAELGTRAGLALANIRLRSQEHAVAHELQRSLLPRRLPAPAGLLIGARYLPAQAEFMVGGDWYDVVELPGGRLGLFVGDVAGHGVAAAANMGQLRSALAGLALTSDEPAVLLDRIQQFSERLGTSMFATLAVASLDPGDGRFSYACAGHPPPLLVRPGGPATFLWAGRSTPIGFRAGGSRGQATARLAVGETLVLYTDGLVESRNEYISLGFERLADCAARLADRPVAELCLKLTELMTGERPSRDDIAVLAVRRSG